MTNLPEPPTTRGTSPPVSDLRHPVVLSDVMRSVMIINKCENGKLTAPSNNNDDDDDYNKNSKSNNNNNYNMFGNFRLSCSTAGR